MIGADTLASLLVAGLAMYGLGLPFAWLLPAPELSRWVYRIAVAPLYAILIAAVGAWLLLWAGIPLHPGQLVLVGAVAWGLAWRRHRSDWRVRESLSSAFGPTAMAVAAGVTWIFSLEGYGLYLPNRDFKNHAYYVAQVADLRAADYEMVLRASPLSPPNEGAFYPLGLHTLLGWAVPTSTWPTLGVTAAAAILAVCLSLPLACVALARQFLPESKVLWVVAGFAVICFPGATATFGIGSVVLLVGTALYAAALVCLWQWCDHPRLPESLALAAAGLGLFILHVAEAWGLALVAVAALPTARWSAATWLGRRTWVLLGAVAVVALALSAYLLRARLAGLLSDDWDIDPNIYSVPVVIARTVAHQPGGMPAFALIWMVLVMAGIWLTRVRRLPSFPVIALLVPLGLAVLASARGVPALLTAPTAPWYGSTSRVFLLAVPVVALLGSLALAEAAERGQGSGSTRSQARGALAVAASAVVLGGLGLQLVPERRADLASALAGAGDTADVGEYLAESLLTGETVLNPEGDGTASLFATSRIPVLAGSTQPLGELGGGHTYGWILGNLMNLSDPEVASVLADLGVAYIAMGTSSVYWDPQVGYDLEALLRQPELSVLRDGTDMTILRYEAGA